MIRKSLKFLSSSPFIKNYYSGIATIFMLHRVDNIDSSKLAPNENMKVSPVFLEKFITILKSEGYEFISLNELYEILLKGYKVKRKSVLTFDDGYKDNFLNAYPILKKTQDSIYYICNFSFHRKKRYSMVVCFRGSNIK